MFTETWTPPVYEEAPDCEFRMMWWPSYACNAECFYCINTWQRANSVVRPPRHRSQDEIDRVCSRFREMLGPCLIEMSGGEPTLHIPMLRSILAAGHHIQMSSNLLMDPSELLPVACERIQISSSFHPISWDFDVNEFIRQVHRYGTIGIKIIGASIVGHPVFLGLIPGWISRLREEGLFSQVHPFCGEFEGRHYPDAYSEWEMEIISSIDESSKMKWILDGEGSAATYDRCAAGWKYIHIEPSGVASRCHVYSALDPIDGGMDCASRNVFDQSFEINGSAKPCPSDHMSICVCEQYHRYKIPRGAQI